MATQRSFLILAFGLVTVIALLYGVSPSWFAATFLGVADPGVNLAHILRAMMCLYLALGLFWLFAAFSEKHRRTAVLTTIVFAGGLVIGRAVSFVLDGSPSFLLLFYAALELTIVPIAWWVYSRSE
ncbi:DUF4345 domain-containing protein [Methylocella sp.]|uniref:DUF4345 domain-containing protein n=1 Tax=Methylocella sp. TaxID=1978226 RepID=UPI0037838F73